MSDLVTIQRDGALAIVTLNRPEAMNALSGALRSQLAQAVNALEAEANIRVMILTGAGEKAFTAGLDLKELGGNANDAALSIATDDPVQSLGRFPARLSVPLTASPLPAVLSWRWLAMC